MGTLRCVAHALYEPDYTSRDSIRLVEKYYVEDGKVVLREVDFGGDGEVDFTDPSAETRTEPVKTTYDEVGRPIVIEAPTMNETTVIEYEDTCGGVKVPTMTTEARFRVPGT